MCVCLTDEPLTLKFGMVFRNDVEKILKLFRGPMVEYLASYGMIKRGKGGSALFGN